MYAIRSYYDYYFMANVIFFCFKNLWIFLHKIRNHSMIEKILHIEAVDPVELFGVNNSNLEILKNTFSKLKIISRGHELKLMGDEELISEFEIKFFQILEYFEKYNTLTNENIFDILNTKPVTEEHTDDRITSYNVCYTKLLRVHARVKLF